MNTGFIESVARRFSELAFQDKSSQELDIEWVATKACRLWRVHGYGMWLVHNGNSSNSINSSFTVITLHLKLILEFESCFDIGCILSLVLIWTFFCPVFMSDMFQNRVARHYINTFSALIWVFASVVNTITIEANSNFYFLLWGILNGSYQCISKRQ